MRAPRSSCQPTTRSVGSNHMLVMQRCVAKIMEHTNVSEVDARYYARQAFERHVVKNMVKKAWNNDLTKPPTTVQLSAASPHACRDSAAWPSPPLPRWLPPQPQRPPPPLNTDPSGGSPRCLMAVTLRPGQSSIVDLLLGLSAPTASSCLRPPLVSYRVHGLYRPNARKTHTATRPARECSFRSLCVMPN